MLGLVTVCILVQFPWVKCLRDRLSKLAFAIYLNYSKHVFDTDSLGIQVLNLSFLSQPELDFWQKKVDEYSQKLKQEVEKSECLGDQSFLYCILNYLNWSQNFNNFDVEMKPSEITDTSIHVDLLHTGSIPERYGKPLMAMEHLDYLIRDSFQEMESDHDLMMEMVRYPVFLVPDKINDIMLLHSNLDHSSGQWKFHFVASQTSKGSEFVHLHIKGTKLGTTNGRTPEIVLRVPNTVARTFLMKSFRSLTQSNFVELPVTEQDTNMNVDLTFQGPAVNIKIKGDETEVFDADLLLALPLQCWPRLVVVYISKRIATQSF